ncbi:MAG: Mpo1-like protein [Bacteroidota bacterium]
MKSVQNWLDEYGESHQNGTNKLIHWICVPIIFFSIVGLLFSIKIPIGMMQFNAAHFVSILVVIYYLRLSLSLGIGMLFFISIVLAKCYFIEYYCCMPLWLLSIILFVLAWIGQFYGHHIEGKKPSFLKDLQFLLIGPLWLMSFVYKKLGIKI